MRPYECFLDRISGSMDKIDALGLQSHDKRTIADETWRRLEKMTGSNKDHRLWITELDIEELDPEERARNLADFMRTVFSHPNVDSIILWVSYAKINLTSRLSRF